MNTTPPAFAPFDYLQGPAASQGIPRSIYSNGGYQFVEPMGHRFRRQRLPRNPLVIQRLVSIKPKFHVRRITLLRHFTVNINLPYKRIGEEEAIASDEATSRIQEIESMKIKSEVEGPENLIYSAECKEGVKSVLPALSPNLLSKEDSVKAINLSLIEADDGTLEPVKEGKCDSSIVPRFAEKRAIKPEAAIEVVSNEEHEEITYKTSKDSVDTSESEENLGKGNISDVPRERRRSERIKLLPKANYREKRPYAKKQ